MHAKGKMPPAPALVYEDDLAVAEWLAARRTYPVMGILEALDPLLQPGLIKAETSSDAVTADDVQAFAPMPLAE